jgi:hypothetical protein
MTISSTYVRQVDDTIAQIEQKDITKFQVMMNSMFKTLRRSEPAS